MNRLFHLIKEKLSSRAALKWNFIFTLGVNVFSYFSFIHIDPTFLLAPIFLSTIFSVAILYKGRGTIVNLETLDGKYFLPFIYLMPYAIFTFFSGSIGAPDGSTRAPSEDVRIIDGFYYLVRSGLPAREISESEYWSYLYGGVRIFTGHSIIFAYLAYIGRYGTRRT
ncbi:hypothetical protein HF888_14820 [Bermanella marisrubri]|uniref:Uncharacterized protein n=1 Tax=Bermanella marisrubri TaxID=207949 RepID=Q1N236_9GAMM|nr:hypothetical protein [Bermanella marisrubri]EAT12328.1 hypothetical protein RED65_15853 [Bermanella marisrubri]QIZ85414.1 hypothetical protein HF888_14820 [Bermanella marisrubri]